MHCQPAEQRTDTFIDLSNGELTAKDLLSLTRTMYSEEDVLEMEDTEPICAMAVVLMSAALIGTTRASQLKRFTRYSHKFISAIKCNMKNSHLWSGGRYDASTWLSPDGTIDSNVLFEDVQVAMGMLWTIEVDSEHPIDTYQLYPKEDHYPSIAAIRKRLRQNERTRYHR